MRPSYCLRLIFQSSSPSLAAELADNAGTFRYTIRNIYNVTVFNGPPVVIWKNYNVYLGIYKSTQVEASPLTLRTPIRKETVYTTGQQWIEFYPDASEDIPNDMLEPKEWKPIDRLCRCRSCSEQSVTPFSHRDHNATE
jgi:hypothetical protein